MWRRVNCNIICLGGTVCSIGIPYYQRNAVSAGGRESDGRVLQVGEVAASKVPVPKTGAA